jgi:hypothetical protein
MILLHPIACLTRYRKIALGISVSLFSRFTPPPATGNVEWAASI